MKVRLEADFDDFEQVVFYRRGVRTRQEEVKRLFGLRRRTIAFTNYGKVLVYVKFKDAAHFEAQGKEGRRACRSRRARRSSSCSRTCPAPTWRCCSPTRRCGCGRSTSC